MLREIAYGPGRLVIVLDTTWPVAIVCAVVTTLFLLFIERTISGRAASWFALSEFKTGHIVLESLRIPIWLASFVGGFVELESGEQRFVDRID